MLHETTENAIPFGVQRCIRRYKKDLQAAITKAIQRRMDELGRDLRLEEICETASEVIFGESNYDRRMEQLCLEAVDQGKFRYLEDLIDELAHEEATGSADL
ncbi:MAG TPA: hypothetical protein VIK18_03905 [Pirellulales bacterium]